MFPTCGTQCFGLVFKALFLLEKLLLGNQLSKSNFFAKFDEDHLIFEFCQLENYSWQSSICKPGNEIFVFCLF